MNFPQNSSCIPKQLGYYAGMKENQTTQAGERTQTTRAIDGHLYAYTNSVIANDNFKCRGMVPVNALQFWANHYTAVDATSGRSHKPATVIVFLADYAGDQLTPQEALEVAADYRYSTKAGFSPTLEPDESPLSYECDDCGATVPRDDMTWHEDAQLHLCPSCEREHQADNDPGEGGSPGYSEACGVWN
jgi:predicted RNA-binding Zn-ribbon protein involved in translation (DUF1610 family)